MSPSLLRKLIRAAKPFYPTDDPSHDWNHICRVMGYAKLINKHETGDWDVIVTAVLFHDCVNHPKSSPREKFSAEDSAKVAGNILLKHREFPKNKIAAVQNCIREHSFSNGIKPKLLESKIVQDADKLDGSGMSAVMRTFGSCGFYGRRFFSWRDPFCKRRKPNMTPAGFGIDLIFGRKAHQKAKAINTKTARVIAKKHDKHMQLFLKMVKTEVEQFPIDDILKWQE